MAVLTDAQIDALVQEPKPLHTDWMTRLRPKAGRLGHQVRDLDLPGEHGSTFRIVVRQSMANALDFSVILAYRPVVGPRLFRLRRYNGRSHEHRNRIEGDQFYDFHIHSATERYQLLGMHEDSFAQATDRFADLAGALSVFVQDCGFSIPSDGQLSWLDGMN
jgi:hypothetical protein